MSSNDYVILKPNSKDEDSESSSSGSESGSGSGSSGSESSSSSSRSDKELRSPAKTKERVDAEMESESSYDPSSSSSSEEEDDDVIIMKKEDDEEDVKMEEEEEEDIEDLPARVRPTKKRPLPTKPRKVAISSTSTVAAVAARITAPKKSTKKAEQHLVVCYSRRTDTPANEAMCLAAFDNIHNGQATYPHPRFPNSAYGYEHPITVKFNGTKVFSWWSKDFSFWLANYSAHMADLLKYNHHFTFTINNEKGCVLEPGVKHTILERFDQLRQLAALVRDRFKQPVDKSITVHIDPISVWTENIQIVNDQGKVVETKKVMRNNLGHVPALVALMRELGLNTLHTSFTQFSWTKVKSRLKTFSRVFSITDLDMNTQRQVMDTLVLPHTGEDIHVQTCSAMDLVADYVANPPTNEVVVRKGPCVGYASIKALTKNESLRNVMRKSTIGCNKNCSCYAFRDLGVKSTTEQCTHGCRYCFEFPENYPLEPIQMTMAQYDAKFGTAAVCANSIGFSFPPLGFVPVSTTTSSTTTSSAPQPI
jgi:hypothetical protein